MYKPPKQVPGTRPTGTSTSGLPHTPDITNLPPPRLAPDETLIAPRPTQPDPHQPGSESMLEPIFPGATPEVVPARPREIEVIDLTSPGQDTPGFPADLVVFGPENATDRVPLEDSGLFMDSSRALYADIEGIGVAGIQTNTQGQFVLSSQSPHQDLLVLTRVEGKSQWRKQSDVNPPAETGWSVPVPSQRPVVELKKLVVSRFQASFLTEPDANGTSWSLRGDLRRKYVHLKGGDAVIVAIRENGDVQAVSATNPNANGPLLERIEGTTLWQEKPRDVSGVKRTLPASGTEQTESGPSKRVRLEQPSEPAAIEGHNAKKPGPNPHLWRTWGQTEPAPSGSIKIGNLHYRTLPGSSLDVAMIRPFTYADGFDGFEGMLIAQSWRQPVRAVSETINPASNSTAAPATQWRVSGPLFEKSLTQTVAETFKDFTAITTRTVARSLFEQANPSSTMTSQGLLHISDTLARWQGKSTVERAPTTAPSLRRFTDPLQLLPITATSNAVGLRTLHLLSVDHNKVAQRVDFQLRKSDWRSIHKGQANHRIRQTFQTLLTRNGYDVFPPTSQSSGGTLVFRRADQTYFMTLRNTTTRVVQYDLPKDLHSPALRTYLGDETHQALIAAHENKGLIWLVGGFHITETRQTDFFIYRVSAPESIAARTPESTAHERPLVIAPLPAGPATRTVASQANQDVPVDVAPPHAISVEGVRHTLLPRAADDLIVYIDDPAHPAHNFDSLEALLHSDRHQQPRGAIRVPPENAWMIDSRLPFEKPLTAIVAEYFPVLSSITLNNVARKQFILANGTETTTGAGLTALRQTFNDWKLGNTALRPELADPLLMLPTVPITAASPQTARKLILPDKVSGELNRIDLEVNYFRSEFDHLLAHPGGRNHKIYMAGLLMRTGYTVLAPSEGSAWPALVFTHESHDQLFFLSLYRVHDNIIWLPDTPNPITSSSLVDRIGHHASQVVLEAEAAGKVVWLKGGIQKAANLETAFIVRDDIPMI